MTRQIYLDHGASTPVHPEVLAAMEPHWAQIYANASSVHRHGQAAATALDNARQQVADLLHAQPAEIIFTGCGSESDNMALRGVMLAARQNGRGEHLITSAIEHSAVLQTAVQLRDLFGFDLTILPVDSYGRVNPDTLRAALRPDTVLVSIMAANNEIGTLQPITELAAITHDHGALFHTDAIQAATTQAWDMTAQPIDLLSISAHKFYGPKGAGILYVREGVEIVSTLTGGGQENGHRAGTSNVAFAVGTAVALQLVYDELDERLHHYTTLRDRLISGILAQGGDDVILTGHPSERLPHNASFAFRHISGNDLLIHLDMAGIAASSGSACKSGNPKPSAVLEAVGLDPEWTKGGLRLTVGTQNTTADIDHTIDQVGKIVKKLQKLQRIMN